MLTPQICAVAPAGSANVWTVSEQLNAVMPIVHEMPVLDSGDVNARVWVRIREVEQSLGLLEQILGRLTTERTIQAKVDAVGGAPHVPRFEPLVAHRRDPDQGLQVRPYVRHEAADLPS